MFAIGSIQPQSRNYTRELKELDAAYRAGTLAILTGAGISMPGPSCVPGGSAIRDQLLRAMVGSLRNYGFNAEASRLADILGARPLELLLDSFTKVHGREALSFLTGLDIDRPNRNHYCIAQLTHGNIKTRLITLNFDVLIETSLDQVQRAYTVRCPLGKDLIREDPHRRGSAEILKPHGSFALPREPRTIGNLATTLSEIRDRPDERTAAAMCQLLGGATTLLVVGYKGEDWDVLPILLRVRRENPGLRLVWVDYLASHHMSAVVDDKEEAASSLVHSVRALLQTFAMQSTLLFGDPSDLLTALVARNWPDQASRIPPHSPCASTRELEWSEFLKPTIATALVAAHALQDVSRDDADRLIEFVGSHRDTLGNAKLRQAYANLAGWRRHIRGDFNAGIALREEALRLNRHLLQQTEAEIARDIVATGYQYLSYAKPRRSGLRTPARLLHYWWKGQRYLVHGAAVGTAHEKAAAAYYRADFRHACWMPLLLAGHSKLVVARRVAFWFVCRAYDNASRATAHLMDREYFFLRRLEAQVLAGDISITADTLAQLAQIEDYFMLTRQLDHLRNLCTTKALLAFARDPGASAVDDYLECAVLDKTGIGNGRPLSLRVQALRNDRCVDLLVELVIQSHDVTTLTLSGSKRYALFLRFMRPARLSFSAALRSAG